MVLAWLALTLVAIGPPVLHPANRALPPVAASVADGNGVATGSLATMAADVRHSAGLELAKRLNAENDGLSKRRTTTRVRVVTGSLAALAADARHSEGAELALRLNAENDGLSARDDARAALLPTAAQSDRPADVERPTWIGFAVFAYRLVRDAMQGAESQERRGETLGFAVSSQNLAASGWSGCAAYRHGADAWGRSVNRTVRDDERKRRPWGTRLMASLLRLPDELAPALGRVARRVGDAGSLWTGILPRMPAGKSHPQWRWARFNVDRTSGL